MPEQNVWAPRLESEIARELGQPVRLVPGGAAPEAELRDMLILPDARLLVSVDEDDLARLLVEARLIEAGQVDPGVVRELWSGILTSVAGRLGGTSQSAGDRAGAEVETPFVCALRLGAATARMALSEIPKESGMPAHLSPAPQAGGNYDLLLEVELDASVRFGSREMQLRELLELGPGDVVELDRHVSDPVDLIVGDKIVAHGEVVLVNGNFGLRVTEVAEPVRRLESIRCLL